MELVTRENLKIQWDEKNLNPYVRYKEQNEEHLIEFLDVATFYNQMKIASSHGIPSIGIWNIGSEDPSIWKLFSNDRVNLSGLETIQNTVSVKGKWIRRLYKSNEGKSRWETEI